MMDGYRNENYSSIPLTSKPEQAIHVDFASERSAIWFDKKIAPSRSDFLRNESMQGSEGYEHWFLLHDTHTLKPWRSPEVVSQCSRGFVTLVFEGQTHASALAKIY